jgi:hypothetical protein
MLYGLIMAAASLGAKARGDRLACRNPLSPRRERHPDTLAEPPNPDFDFGPSPTPLALTRPATAERRFARILLILLLLALVPLGFLVTAFIVMN